MTRGLLFWVIFIVAVIFAGAVAFGFGREYGVGGFSGLVTMVLLLLLGWQVYGPPVRG